MKLLNSIYFDSPFGTRSFELWHGDVTNLDFGVDLLMISAVESDFTPLKGTVIGELARRMGLSVESLSKAPELDFVQPSGRLWVSKGVNVPSIGRILCIEIPFGGADVDQIVQQAFRSLPMLEARGLQLKTISLPILGTGSHGLEIEALLRPILEGAHWALRILKSAERVCFVEINEKRANEMNIAMDEVLGRVKVTLARGVVVEAIKAEISAQLEKLDDTDSEVVKLSERLNKAISSDSRSADIGMAGRLLREFVIARVLSHEDTKKLTPFDTMVKLRQRCIANWVIRYLDLLHAFGNESAHHKTQQTRPPEIESEDLTVCLFAIQRVMDFWIDWHSAK